MGYNKFDGIYLTPYNHKNVENYTRWAALPDIALPMKHSFCKRIEPDGSTWNVQKVGPFTSSGGYDWWKFAGHDVARLAKEVRTHKTIHIVESMLGAIDIHGRLLPYPPIHLHHIHLTFEQPCLRFDDPLCYHVHYVLERHGEWAYDISWSEREMDGYGRAISLPLVFDTELNDARPANSSTLTWFLVFALKWTSKRLSAVSYVRFFVSNVYFREGKRVDPWADQGVRETYFFVPTHGKYINWHSATYRGPEGQLLYVKGHNHHNLLVKGFMFATTPADMGLRCPRFCSAAHAPVEAEVVPLPRFFNFSIFDELESWLLAGQAPICTVEPNYAIQKGIAYDRAPSMWCSRYSLKTEQTFTFVTFLEYHTEHNPEPWLLSVPSTLPMHANWFLAVNSSTVSCFLTFYSSSKGGLGPPGGACSSPLASNAVAETECLTTSFLGFSAFSTVMLFTAGYALAASSSHILL